MNLKIIITALFFAVLISGCVQAPKSVEKEIPFETIEKGEYSHYSENHAGNKSSGYFVLNDKESWEKFYVDLRGSPTIDLAVPPVDFSASTVIAVVMGQKSTGGYSIEITKIVEGGTNLLAYVNETSPGRGALVTEALTQPYHIVKTQKITKPVEFQKV